MSKKEVVEKQKKSFVYSLIVVVGLFVLVFGIIKIIQLGNYKEYNHFEFKKDGILWVTELQKGDQPYYIPFYYFPEDLEDINAQPLLEQSLLDAALNKPNTTVYITLDPELPSRSVVAAVELSRLTGDRYKILNLPTRSALTKEPIEQSANSQFPIVTCNDKNEDNIVIWIKYGSTNSIFEYEDCIILQAVTENDLVRVADRFAYMILGIMP